MFGNECSDSVKRIGRNEACEGTVGEGIGDGEETEWEWKLLICVLGNFKTAGFGFDLSFSLL